MKTIFEKSLPGLTGTILPELDVPENRGLPAGLLRRECALPEITEGELIRHYTALSRRNLGVDNAFYPLGSCTMKYNPKVHEKLAGIEAFRGSHPLAPPRLVQGNLELIWALERALCEITGMHAFSLQPSAGAHGELSGLMIMKAFFRERGEERDTIITPDSSHGTNPASAAMCGFKTITLKSNPQGEIDPAELERTMTENTAGLMLTNPNTLGLFDSNILTLTGIVHGKGGLVYGDGANANAVLGVAKFRDMGFDLIHLNLHKTFSTPHGGGGPGAGPLGVSETLRDFLPAPLVVKNGNRFEPFTPAHSIGRVKAFYGNFSIFIRALAYILSLGAEGLKQVTRAAVLNANYLRALLVKDFNVAYKTACKHEFVLDDSTLPGGVTTMDLAKRLLDYGFHPPTVYFPLIVKGALMIEPTETETRETMDLFADVLKKIKQEAAENPEMVKGAPHSTPVSRLDEVQAARKPVLRFVKEE
jgi:glycine dehydrogenase subunit 2